MRAGVIITRVLSIPRPPYSREGSKFRRYKYWVFHTAEMLNLPVYNFLYTIEKNHLQALFIGARIVPILKLGRRSVRTVSEYSLVSDRSK